MNAPFVLCCVFSALLACPGFAQNAEADAAAPSNQTSISPAAVSKLAAALAAALANKEARTKFDAAPFSAAAAPAVFRASRWEWQATAGYGKGDLRATVSFREDGSDPKVRIQTLVNETSASSKLQ